MPAVFDAISEPVSRRVASGLARIGQVLRTNAWRGAAAAGITPTQGNALGFLRASAGGIGLGALARMLGVSPPTASDAVSALVAKGLVDKEPGPDRRSIALVLSAAGEAVADRTGEWPGFLADAVDTLEDGEKAALLRSTVKLIRALQVSGHVPHQRMCVTCGYFRPHAHDDARDPHHCAYVDAAFGDRHLRIDCREQVDATPAMQDRIWHRFAARGGGTGVAEERG